MVDIAIRPPESKDDFDALRALCRGYRIALCEATKDQPGIVERYYDPSDFETLLGELAALHAPPGGVFLGLVDGTPLGCGMTHHIAPGVAEIKRVYTAPPARGLGLGRAIMQAAMDHARDSGATRMVLDTMRPLTSACRLYETLGFEPIEPFYQPQPQWADYILFYGRDL
ncbi:GNAT family N-acetyltransferase [Rhodobacteraceae bacterium D3-12]|nr:GNAT family N-acetyltransferase [Rhodobacteraceae bacterium D3-12]